MVKRLCKIGLIAFLLVALVVPLIPAQLVLAAPVLISTSEDDEATSHHTQRKLVRLSDGTLWTVYRKKLATYYQIYVKKSTDDGTTWIGETLISTYSGMDVQNQDHPSIAADSSDNVYVVWKGKTTTDVFIWYTKYTGSWATPARVSDHIQDEHYPSLAVDSSNNLHVVWYSYGPGYSYNQIWYSKYTTSWSTPVRISTANGMQTYDQIDPSIAVDSSSYLHVVWQGRATGYSWFGVWYAKYTGSWAAPVRISTGMDGYLQMSPSVAINSSNNIHVVWYGRGDGFGGNTQIWYNVYVSSWGTPVRISDYSGMNLYVQEYPSIAVDSEDNLHVVWHGKATGYIDYNKIWYARYIGSWATPEVFQATGQNQCPNIRWSLYPSSNIPTAQIDYVFTEGTGSPYNVKFDFTQAAPSPSVTTQDATDITSTTATLHGNLTDLGEGATDCDVWFVWSLVEYDFENSTTPENKVSTGTFYKSINLPVGGREYKYQAVAENNLGGKTYGNTITFWAPPFPVTVAEDNYVDYEGVITHVFQRKAWYAAGRHWVIYLKKAVASPDGGFYWKSSTDGMSWSSASLFREVEVSPDSETINESDELNVYFDGTYLHAVYLFNRNTNNSQDSYNKIWYRRGTPNSDGTISWSSGWVVALDRDTTTVKGYASIVTDTNGYPWIDYWQSDGLDPVNFTPTGQWDRKVIKSSTKDGTFTIATGYPYTLKADMAIRATGCLVQLPDNKLYWVGCCGVSGEWVVGRLYNGTSWEGEVTIASDARGHYRFSVVAREEVIYVVYTKSGSPATDIKFSMMLESGWTTPTTIITGLGFPPYNPMPAATMTIDNVSGDLYVFYADYNTDHIKYRVYDNSSQTWGSTEDMIDESGHHLVCGELSTTIGSYFEVSGDYAGVYYLTADPDYSYMPPPIGQKLPPYENGVDLRFYFLGVTTAPSVRTDSATSITQTTATLNGFLISDGGQNCSVRFQWGTDTTYGTDTTWQPDKTSSTSFNQGITGLTSNTTYHFRAQAKWADETTSSGIDQTFVTTAAGIPTVTTFSAVETTLDSATLQGSLDALGDYSSVYVSFEYGLSTAYGTTTADQTKTSIGGFSADISSLIPNTTYHFRARVRYDSSYAYGTDVSFVTTALGAPSITTAAATEVIGSGAKLQGTLDSLGNFSPVYVYFEYGQTTAYGITTAEQTKTSTGGFYQTVGGLTPGTTYHFRAVGRYDSSYVYGNDRSFITPLAGEPGIDPPDILRIDDIKVFTDYLESNDQLYVIAYRIVYTAGTPILDVTDYFDFQLLDGAILKAQVPVKSWDYKPGSIYLAAMSAPAWGGDYRVKIIGTPDKWETPPECYRDLTPGDWQGEDLTQLDAWVLSLAESLQNYYNTEMITYVTGGQSVLSPQGGVIFNMGIPGLSRVRPNLFSAKTGYSDIDLETDRSKAKEEALKASSEERLGPYLTGRLQAVADLLPGDFDFRETAGVGLGLLYLVLALTIGAIAGNMLWGLSTAVLVFGPGVYFGVITPTMISFIAFVSTAIFIYQVWWKHA